MTRTAGLVLASIVGGEKLWLNHFSTPREYEAKLLHIFTVDEGQTATLDMVEPLKVAGTTTTQWDAMLMDKKRWETMPKEPAICCSEVEGTVCPTATGVRRDVKNVQLINLGKRGASIPKVESGTWFLILANCHGGKKAEAQAKILEGEISMGYKYGYLPGGETVKMQFYGVLALGYLGLVAAWIGVQVMWRSVLFRIHHYLTAAAVVGMVEACCWYMSWYHWNLVGHRWWSMSTLAVMGTVIKRLISYLALLLACQGVGVTKSKVDRSTSGRMMVLGLVYAVFAYLFQSASLEADAIQFWPETVISVENNWSYLIFVNIMSSLTETTFWVWIYTSCNATLGELEETKQTVKAERYYYLKRLFVISLMLFGALMVGQILMRQSVEIKEASENEWLYGHVVPHLMFLGLVAILMYLWRPSERSKDMAFQIQLGEEPVGNTAVIESVHVELGDDDIDGDDFDMKKSVEIEMKSTGNQEVVGAKTLS